MRHMISVRSPCSLYIAHVRLFIILCLLYSVLFTPIVVSSFILLWCHLSGLLLLLLLIANLNVSQMILIISINSPCDPILTLLNSSLICTNQLILCCIMLATVFMQRITTDLDLSAINCDLSRTIVPSLLLLWLLPRRFLMTIHINAMIHIVPENAETKRFWSLRLHRPLGEFPARDAFSHSWGLQIVKGKPIITLF